MRLSDLNVDMRFIAYAAERGELDAYTSHLVMRFSLKHFNGQHEAQAFADSFRCEVM